MKIFDCFMYFDEDVVLDLRLNYLNNYVEKFIIVESTYAHNGKKRNLNFDINNFKKFKDKIIYLVSDHEPPGIVDINENDSFDIKNGKYILNSMKRDFYQRNYIQNGIKDVDKDDFILTLPGGGWENSTLEKRLIDEGDLVRAKTGGLSGVRNLAGYIKSKKYGDVAFSILMNGYTDYSSRYARVHDQIVKSIIYD